MKKGLLYDRKTGKPIDRDDDDILQDGEALRIPIFLTDGQPPQEREFVTDTIGRPMALRTHAERLTRDAALNARDADYKRTMTRNFAPDASGVTFGPGVEGEPEQSYDPEYSVSPDTAKKLAEIARAKRNADLQTAWQGNQAPSYSAGQLDLAVKESLLRYGLLK